MLVGLSGHVFDETLKVGMYYSYLSIYIYEKMGTSIIYIKLLRIKVHV